MTNTKNLKLDNELKQLAQCVYKGNEKYIPKDWLALSEYDNNKTGFYGQAFYKDRKIVLSFRGTNNTKDLKNDLQMVFNNLPSQYIDAQNFYKQIKKDFPNQEIVLTGHSLGGSVAQLMGNFTGNETVTFNAYGVGDLIQQNEIKESNIRNYGNINDTVFNSNLNNQLGKVYITGVDKNAKYITKNSQIDYIGGLHLKKYHSIEDMGNLEDATEYIKDVGQQLLRGNLLYNIEQRDVDPRRVITQEEIAKMSNDEFERNEEFINQQYNAGNVMSKAEADKKVQSSELIWVNSYVRDDGTQVSGYYRRK